LNNEYAHKNSITTSNYLQSYISRIAKIGKKKLMETIPVLSLLTLNLTLVLELHLTFKFLSYYYTIIEKNFEEQYSVLF